MRIAYIYFLLGNMPGIEKKICHQARAVSQLSAGQIDFFMLNRGIEKFADGIHYRLIKLAAGPWAYYELLFKKYDLIAHSVDLSSYDVVILRYPYADRSGIDFAGHHCLITEHNSNEIPELMANLQNPHVHLSLKAFRRIRLEIEKKYANPQLARCAGFITITDELRQAKLKQLPRPLPAQTIPTGVSTDSITPTGYQPFHGRQMNLAFMSGEIQPWHGFDRLLAGLKNFSGPVRIKIHLIGHIQPENLKGWNLDPDFFIFHGLQTGENLDRILANCHVAVGSLGLFRNQMTESSPLKTREYMARGLPFVIAGKDPDLSPDDVIKSSYLEFPNDASPLDFDRIVEFVTQINRTYPGDELSALMRDYCRTHLDWTIKMQKYVEFAKLVSKK